MEKRNDDRPLDVSEAADRLGTTARHVRTLIARGDLAHVRIGRLVRVLPADITAYLDAHRVEAA